MQIREVQTTPAKKTRRFVDFILITLFLAFIGGVAYYFQQTRAESASYREASENYILYDSSLTSIEQETIKTAIESQKLKIKKQATIKAKYTATPSDMKRVVETLIPVTQFNAVRQKVTKTELAGMSVKAPSSFTDVNKRELAEALKLSEDKIGTYDSLDAITESEVALIPLAELNYQLKVLWLDDAYYLDSFTSGALFREITIDGAGAESLSQLNLATPVSKDSVYKVNMTGVTALTRVMMRKLDSVRDPLYFSELIGEFLADADLTHISNEVSFKEGCVYNNALFCSPPEFIETLKNSGVDLVELTGNHNNDVGSEYNTQTINTYEQLGWATVGGGLNSEEAAKPFTVDAKGTKITFLAYNYPDSPNGGAIAGTNKAGANSFDYEKIESDIQTAKQAGNFVVVDIQYWECYAYPDGYDEFPECDKPIGKQEEDFKKVSDLGADIVIGSSAHQPQTYELYNGKPIYYGLGNLYFEQTSWPGTERGIILTHYFKDGKLLQTKLTPTVYDKSLQTRIMTDTEADYLLTRLHDARY